MLTAVTQIGYVIGALHTHTHTHTHTRTHMHTHMHTHAHTHSTAQHTNITQFIFLAGPGFNVVLRYCDFKVGPFVIDEDTSPAVSSRSLNSFYLHFIA